jgi:hypothetical protein
MSYLCVFKHISIYRSGVHWTGSCMNAVLLFSFWVSCLDLRAHLVQDLDSVSHQHVPTAGLLLQMASMYNVSWQIPAG